VRIVAASLFAVSAIILSGCVTKPTPMLRYSKPGGTQQQFLEDRYTCLQQAQQPRSAGFVNQYGGASSGTVVTSRAVFLSCMSVKGYSLDADGEFAAPPGTQVQLSE
jgi:hypothetical protein